VGDIVSFLDPDGVETIFNDPPDILMPGVEGRYMPPFEFSIHEVPEQAGAVLDRVKVGVREVVIPWFFTEADEETMRSILRSLAKRFDPTRGPGRLRVEDSLGTQRELTCYYAEGFGMVEDKSTHGFGSDRNNWWKKVALVFRALDPYWYDTVAISQTFQLGETPATFFPFFPLRLTGSEIFAEPTVDNSGDVEAWPIWQINGPGTGPITLQNVTSGKSLELNQSPLVGESITIDTAPGEKTVLHSDGSNVFSSLSSDSSLWPLLAGPNALRIEMANATVDSSVVLTYRRRYNAQ
jgi:phage-related protein